MRYKTERKNFLLSVDAGVWAVVENEARANHRTVTGQANYILSRWVEERREEVQGQTDLEVYAATKGRARRGKK